MLPGMVHTMTDHENTMYILTGLYFSKQAAEKYHKACAPVPKQVIEEKTADLLQKANADAIQADIMQGIKDIINGV